MTAWTLDSDHPFSREAEFKDDVKFAWRSLVGLCGLLGVDPTQAAGRRRKDEALLVRKMWFYLTRPFITGTLLAKITGYNRSTIEDDFADVTAWRRADETIDELMDTLTDSMEGWKSVIGGADNALALMKVRHEDRRKAVIETEAKPAPAKAKTVEQLNREHALVMILVRSREVMRALGPIVPATERPKDAMAWAHVEDSTGAQTICLSWAGHRDTLQDALPALKEALRIAGRNVSLAEVSSHPTLKMKYQARIRIGAMLKPISARGAAPAKPSAPVSR